NFTRRTLRALAPIVAAALCLGGSLLGWGVASAPAAAAATTHSHTSISDTKASHRTALTIVPATDDSDPFIIQNYNSGLCLGIAGGEDDASAVQWPCNGSANQSWHWGSGISGSFGHLING